MPGSSARDQKSKFGTNGNGRVSDSESEEEELIEEDEEEVGKWILKFMPWTIVYFFIISINLWIRIILKSGQISTQGVNFFTRVKIF